MQCTGVCKAIREQEPQFALRLLEDAAPAALARLDCPAPAHQGTSVLHAALASGNPHKIQMASRFLPPEGFLARGASGLLPLEAVLASRPPLAVLHEVLASASAAPEALVARFGDGKAPFHHLVDLFNAGAVAELARHFSQQAIMVPSSDGEVALHALCKMSDSLPAVLRLMEMLSPSCFEVVDPHGNTPLHLAIAHGADDVALALARKTSLGAASAANCSGSSVLHLAITAGLAELALVLAVTLPPDALLLQDNAGLTALHLAVVGQMEALVEELIRRVPPVHLEVCDRSGRHVLILAILYRYPEHLRELIACVAPAGKLSPGLDEEIAAAGETNRRLVERLLAAHPLLASLPDAMGRRAVHWAAWRQNSGAMAVLLERVSREELVRGDPDGLHVLHWSALRGVDRIPLAQRGVMLPLVEMTELVRGPRVSLWRPPTYAVRYDWEPQFLESPVIRQVLDALGPDALGPDLLLKPDRLGRIPVHYAVLCNDHFAVSSLGRMLSETERLIADRDGVTPAAVAEAVFAVDDIIRMFPTGEPHCLPGSGRRNDPVTIPRRDRVVSLAAKNVLEKAPPIQKKKGKKKKAKKAALQSGESPAWKMASVPAAETKAVTFSAKKPVTFSARNTSSTGAEPNVAFSPHSAKGSSTPHREKVVAFSPRVGKVTAKPQGMPKELGKCKCGYSGSTATHLHGIVASLLRAKGGSLKRDSIDGVVGDQHGKESVYWLRQHTYGPHTRATGRSIVYTS